MQLTRTGAAKNQVESSLAEELRKEREALRAKDSAIKELEKEWRGKLHALETQMAEKQELLQVRSTDLEALKSELGLLTVRVTEAAINQRTGRENAATRTQEKTGAPAIERTSLQRTGNQSKCTVP